MLNTVWDNKERPPEFRMEYSERYDAWVWVDKRNGLPLISLDSFFHQVMEWKEL